MIIGLLTILPLSASACDGPCNPADCAAHKAEGGCSKGHDMASADKAEGAVLDPICGMKIEKTHAAAQVEHDGKTYYFCMEEEKNTFLKDPAKYIKNN